MRSFASAALLGAILAACEKKAAPPPPAFELRSVVAPRIAALETEIGPEPPAPQPDAETAERVRGLLDGFDGADVRMRKIFADEMSEIGEAALPLLAACVADESASNAQRLSAVRLAGEIDGPRVAEWLTTLVETAPQPWMRANAAWQLASSSQDQVVPRLILRLKYEIDGETVIWLAAALGHFGNDAGLDGLGMLASRGPTEELRAAAAERRALLAKEAGGAEPSPSLRLEVWRCIERLGRQDLRSVDDARFVLSRCSAWVFEPLCEALHEEVVYVRTHAAQCLERMGARASAAGPVLVEALDEPRLASAAAAALGAIGWPPAGPELERRLDSSVDPELRNAAARALGTLKRTESIEPLRKLLATEEPIDLRQAAAQSLVVLGRGDDVAAFLVECLRSDRADASAAETHVETWLAARAEGGDEEAHASLARWKELAPAPGTTPVPAENAERRRARALLLESSPLLRKL